MGRTEAPMSDFRTFAIDCIKVESPMPSSVQYLLDVEVGLAPQPLAVTFTLS
jgi:hypothetical protein